MVWPWPPDSHAHDPEVWVFPQGRFHRERWKAGWEELFRTHELVHNVRRAVRIVVSQEGDGGFGVVDVDTLWRRRADGSRSLEGQGLRLHQGGQQVAPLFHPDC
jgi:hypothetical protein